MSSFETTDTEETVSCLHIIVYHPSQEEKQVFRELNFCQQLRLSVNDLVKFGRDSNVCDFTFIDSRVSRIQFALQFFRHFNSTQFGFEIKNLSKKTKLIVDNIELTHLNKVDLPDNCFVRFGDYQFQMQKQGGQSEEYFEVCFDLSKTSLLQEKYSSWKKPVPESGISYTELPTEMDENE